MQNNMLENNLLNVVLPTNVGEINEIKIKKLYEKLRNKFPICEYNTNNFINFFNNERTKQISINSNTIILSIISPKFISENDINELYNNIAYISDVLMIETNFKNASIQNSSNFKFNDDSMEVIKNLALKSLNTNELNNCIGAGFRFLYKNEQGLFDEFKFEPLISNSNFIYAEGIYNYINIPLDSFTTLVNKNLNDFENRFKGIIDNIK